MSRQYYLNGSCIVANVHVKPLCKYRGLTIFEVLTSGELPYHASASIEWGGYHSLSLDSKRFTHFGYRSGPAIEEVKQKIDEFVNNIAEPHYVKLESGKTAVEYWYYGPTTIQINPVEECALSILEDRFKDEHIKDAQVKIECLDDTCEIKRNPKGLPENVKAAIYTGIYADENGEHPFKVVQGIDSPYYFITVNSTDDEYVADELAKFNYCYDCKPVACKLRDTDEKAKG